MIEEEPLCPECLARKEVGKTYRIKAFQYIVEGVKRLLFLKR
jgi:hypothetical protein